MASVITCNYKKDQVTWENRTLAERIKLIQRSKETETGGWIGAAVAVEIKLRYRNVDMGREGVRRVSRQIYRRG
ncbi:MAG TPA: hypothetical protein VHK01_21345 [Lacipirellulaceae bacterium]|nr:hypothetical protein [Lacipirellulaceae bacterium]